MSPLEIVNRRMEAYNNHKLTEFLANYADDIKIYDYPDNKIGSGKEHLKSIFEPMFEKKSVYVKIHNQIAKDRYVINHETVSYSDKDTEYVSIYEVRNQLIQSVRFVRD